jgi:hypothetical protein
MQQINLYLPEFKPNREPLRSIHMVWAALAFILLLIAFSFYSSARNSQLEQALDAERKAMETLQLDLQKISAQQARNQPAQLDAEIERIQGEIARRRQILGLISSQNFGNTSGFSEQLRALARQSLDTLAVESFSLLRGGNYVELTGKTHRADQVPLYLQRLRSEPGFASVGFGVLNVEREKEGGAALNFTVAKPKEQEGK